ncbi:MAG: enoyl-CoA hydratase/isomerase family protein [Dehalococcoidia bacterium]
MSETLLLERHGSVAVLTLNRPQQRNALNTELRDAISAAFDSLASDGSVSVAVVTGNGPVFCAGFDLKEFDKTPMQEVFAGESSRRYHEALRTFPKPLVAAVNGSAMAGGFDIVAFCDLRVASTAAAFGHPEIRFGSGVMYGPLADLIGAARASEIVFRGEPIDAQEALRIGLLTRVVPPEELLPTALAVANEIARSPLSALQSVKQAVIARRS